MGLIENIIRSCRRRKKARITIKDIYDKDLVNKTIEELSEVLKDAPEKLSCNCVWTSCIKAKRCRDRI